MSTIPTVLVTGSNRGIGLEFVRQYAADGYRVFACCRHPKEAKEASGLRQLAKEFPNIQLYLLDVANANQIQKLSDTLKNETIDILINNAGIYGGTHQRLGDLDVENLQTVFLTNAIGPLKMAEAFRKQVASSHLKTIVSISSDWGSITDMDATGVYAYAMSKAALNMAMKGVSIDVRSEGIRVLIFNPGWVQTDMGGPGATTPASTSVAGIRKVIEQKRKDWDGLFFSHTGQEMPW